MKYTVALLFLMASLSCNSARAQSGTLPTVKAEQFAVGNFWDWTYSGLNKESVEWQPYLIEHYSVAAVEGTKLTIEMRSSPIPYQETEPHHKFIVDLADCEKASREARFRNFTIRFYTKSLGDGWQLVSSAHTNLPFTEKFNCVSDPRPNGITEGEYDGAKIFRFASRSRDEASWYFLDREGLAGVTAQKTFEPRREYKAELTGVGQK